MAWKEVPRSDPARFTLTTMRKRLDKVGDLTAGMWRRKASLLPRFEDLELEPGDPSIVALPRSGRAVRWERDQGGWNRRSPSERRPPASPPRKQKRA